MQGGWIDVSCTAPVTPNARESRGVLTLGGEGVASPSACLFVRLWPWRRGGACASEKEEGRVGTAGSKVTHQW